MKKRRKRNGSRRRPKEQDGPTWEEELEQDAEALGIPLSERDEADARVEKDLVRVVRDVGSAPRPSSPRRV